ncbi:hypothetical protein Halru_2903 [Halovivax ruber XH-70]|uniref:Uncharacterized protein n=1 Tax=Halovivax ruber (strain DSM 18193 / JCM 13892 / XH-70) TaxID=797302 RepID=L0IF58_HALRX|nr:MJ0042-type zinc finger domain-containing protein [Halovivax ruber]AGB17473.1 hypothetical protein Halru_2903 [Halovivax ruber XH-70]
METPQHSTFVCPECASSFVVDDDKRAALVEHGCVRCGTALTPDAFA